MTNLRDWADPILRYSIETLFGPERAKPDNLRGKSVATPSRLSTDEIVRTATRDLVGSPPISRRSRRAGRHAPTPWRHTSRDARILDVKHGSTRWSAGTLPGFGPRHATVSTMAASELSRRRRLPLSVDPDRRDPLDPVALATRIGRSKDSVTRRPRRTILDALEDSLERPGLQIAHPALLVLPSVHCRAQFEGMAFPPATLTTSACDSVAGTGLTHARPENPHQEFPWRASL